MDRCEQDGPTVFRMCTISLSVTFRQDGRPAAQSLLLPGSYWSFQPGNIEDQGVYSVVSAAAGTAAVVSATAAASRAIPRRAFTGDSRHLCRTVATSRH